MTQFARFVQASALPFSLLALWQVSSSQNWINRFFFPPPFDVLTAAWRMALDGALMRETGATLYRLAWGVIIGCSLGLATGVAMGTFGSLRRAGQPLVAALYTTPKVALLPLVMLILGIGDASRIALIAAVAFIFLASQTTDAIAGVHPGYVETARNCGAGTWAVIRHIYLPASLPQIFTGLRIALSRSLVTLISLEMVSSTDGIGALIWVSWEALATTRLYVGIMTAIVLGLILHASLSAIENAAVPWRRKTE